VFTVAPGSYRVVRYTDNIDHSYKKIQGMRENKYFLIANYANRLLGYVKSNQIYLLTQVQ